MQTKVLPYYAMGGAGVAMRTENTPLSPAVPGRKPPLRPRFCAGPASLARLSQAVLPCTRRFVLQPDWTYLAESAILSRLSVSLARVWMNRPENIKDPRLNIDQKRQAFWERFMVEIFGTPAYMAVMHLTQDLTGLAMESLGILPRHLRVPSIPSSQMARANQILRDVTGEHGLWGRVIFQPQQSSYTAYLARLQQAGLQPLTQHPAFLTAAEAWFRKSKVATSFTILAGMLASAIFGGVGIQKLNDRWFAPHIGRLLKNHEDVRLPDNDLTLQV
jgi:hypothetical protein